MIQISVVILHYKEIENTRNCLDSLDKTDFPSSDLEINLVNASPDQDLTVLKSRFNIHLLTLEKNLGYAGGNNVGIKKALTSPAPYIWILNNDTEVKKDCPSQLLNFAKKHPGPAIFGPKIYFSPGHEFHKNRYAKSDLGKVIWWAGGKVDWDNITTIHEGLDEVDKGGYDQAKEVSVVTGTAMFISREVFESLGFLEEKYFLYFEESDFCERAAKTGFKMWLVPQAVVWHKNAASSGVGSPLQDYYTTRNRLLFAWRYAPLRSKLAILRESWALLAHGRHWQKRGVRDFYLQNFGPGSYQST